MNVLWIINGPKVNSFLETIRQELYPKSYFDNVNKTMKFIIKVLCDNVNKTTGFIINQNYSIFRFGPKGKFNKKVEPI